MVELSCSRKERGFLEHIVRELGCGELETDCMAVLKRDGIDFAYVRKIGEGSYRIEDPNGQELFRGRINSAGDTRQYVALAKRELIKYN